ncbi:M20/M25/M40 family metallo-hydrolase [Kordiimonas pumila]|uniref:Carboxypeptidase Q n=1 Tax=Kordiimonas pumila TaxID=2161677 RepID=A0ABV7D1E2_9PROT|nr:M20/M25/M40 family metallo-hydrolase [Kordiimonas pumila]
MKLSLRIILLLSFAFSCLSVQAGDEVDLAVMTQIREEGFKNSQVMETVSYLSDVIGPRLTGSPALKQANIWTKETLEKWGLVNGRLEGFDFGPGWTADHVSVFMTAPRNVQLSALPISWHPGTNGVLHGAIYYAPMDENGDFRKYKGKLAGKIVFVDKLEGYQAPSNEVMIRRTEKDLIKSKNYRIPNGEQEEDFDWWVEYITFHHELESFLAEEGALAMVRQSTRDAMLIEASGYKHIDGQLPKIPGVVLAAEHYRRAVRLLRRDMDVELSIDVDAEFYTQDLKSYSTLADIEGALPNPNIVMVGAHLDSWVGGDGAADNAAGVAVVMEAVRILKAINVTPHHTIRVALWGGEEQGYFGSQQYATNHLTERPKNTNEDLRFMGPYELYYNQFPMITKPDYDQFSVYFNLDNGSGKIRGIYSEGNLAAGAIFKDWLVPFHDIGAATVTMNITGGTDHEVFDHIGLPAFQFIQDPLDYESRVHHTQVDTLDHIAEGDLKQAAVVLAGFIYNAAMQEEKMPRKPLPVATPE